MRPVAAYPTIAGSCGERHRTDESVNPSLRSLTSSRSIALETVGVSSARSLSRTPAGACLIVWSVLTYVDLMVIYACGVYPDLGIFG